MLLLTFSTTACEEAFSVDIVSSKINIMFFIEFMLSVNGYQLSVNSQPSTVNRQPASGGQAVNTHFGLL